MGFLNSLGASLTSNASNLLVYIAIVVTFVLGVVLCVMPVMRNRRLLKRGVRLIRQGTKARRNWQQEDFLGSGSLMPHWSAYLNNLFFAEGEYHNASNVEDFINEETTINGPGRSALAEAVPSLLVSLGFLGTLIGLAQGLSGFDMTDSTTAQQSIMVLIPGMKYAFMTSIFGVIGSILFTMLTRAVYGSTENALRRFYGAMSHSAGVLSVDPLTQVAIYQQEQTELIRTMAKDINGAFTKTMSDAIKDAMEPMTASMRSFMTVTSKEQMRFLDAVVVRFVERMDVVLDGKLKHFGEVLDETTRNQLAAFAAVKAGMASAQEALNDVEEIHRISSEMVRSMSDYLDDLRDAQKQSADTVNRVAGAVGQMDAITQQQTGYLRTLSNMQTEINRSMSEMTRAVEGCARRFADENATAAQAMRDAADDMRSAGAQLSTIHAGAVQAIDDELQATLTGYQKLVDQFHRRMDDVMGDIDQSLAGLPAAVHDTANAFLDQMDALNRSLGDGQRALDDAVDRLYGRR